MLLYVICFFFVCVCVCFRFLGERVGRVVACRLPRCRGSDDHRAANTAKLMPGALGGRAPSWPFFEKLVAQKNSRESRMTIPQA